MFVKTRKGGHKTSGGQHFQFIKICSSSKLTFVLSETKVSVSSPTPSRSSPQLKMAQKPCHGPGGTMIISRLDHAKPEPRRQAMDNMLAGIIMDLLRIEDAQLVQFHWMRLPQPYIPMENSGRK
jgi:hypothetical protein